MDSSRRAVESYWRSRMIDGATSDEDKGHACLQIRRDLRGSFGLRMLALRLIKYAVGKSGVEFRREMQRHSVAVRQLLHYKGQLDALKGDALNKAVRDTAQETISAIFAAEENKPALQKILIDEFKGISSITQGHSLRKNDNGSYKSPNLRRSLTTEIEYQDRYEGVEHQNETQSSFGSSKNVSGGPWNQDVRITKSETTNGDSSSSFAESKTREERLLETIVTSGGVRLQPTRDAIQIFLIEAAKLDALALSHALESKLHSPLWQVRMKAVCVLDSILRKKDEEQFSTVASYFCENKDVVLKCCESPQASLREKANKVLSLLGGEQTGSTMSPPEKPLKTETVPAVQMPDLIDTGGPDDYYGAEDSIKTQMRTLVNKKMMTIPLQMSHFSSGEAREQVDDLFSGMTVDDKVGANEIPKAATSNEPELFDIFGSNAELPQEQENHKKDVNDLMAGLSINGNVSNTTQKGMLPGALSETVFSDSNSYSPKQVSNDALNGFGSETAGMNANAMFPLVQCPIISLQALSAVPSSNVQLQQLGNLTSQSAGMGHAGGTMEGGYSSPLPDIFHPHIPTQSPTAVMTSSKKEETKAFDFISDHLAAARDPKRVI
ncbi:VHS domain-containing protein [Vitis vinifera]|uniref:VHS domain-containing protein n=1 Tax=Vitis vinifera TaxID=29760 RepID=A0A438CUQ2_VITVI|nr:VHS domain-containing protein [Vitis vinifera]